MTDSGQNLQKLFFKERNQGKKSKKSKKSRGIIVKLFLQARIGEKKS